jgi:hypothetical protein
MVGPRILSALDRLVTRAATSIAKVFIQHGTSQSQRH